jgi:uncharacterized protein (UPF0262 family)
MSVAVAGRLVAVTLDEAILPAGSPEAERERRVAVADLLEENRFDLPAREGRAAPSGPYRLGLSVRERRLVFALSTEGGEPAAEFHLSLGPFRQVVKDYFQICESYWGAVASQTPTQIETIDMARRGIHDEGARVLCERLAGKAELDAATARRLFTLICALLPGAA